MKKEPNIDELLNSYIDEELTPRQQTEVKRLVANDPQIAHKLQQLQKCKILVSSLPVTKAPSRVLDNIKTSIEMPDTSDSHARTLERQTNTRLLLVRKVLAAAAVLAIAAVLAVVFRTISPTTDREDYGVERVVSRAEFRGTLELKTSEFAAVDSVLNRAFENNSLSDSLISQRNTNRCVYSLSCTKESLDNLLDDLSSSWNKLDSTRLFVSTGIFGEPIEIDAINPDQVTEMADQVESGEIIALAKDYAIINKMTERSPGRGVLPFVEDSVSGLIPIPVITRKTIDKATSSEEGEKTVNLTIVLSR
jgi:hypothetical protein